MVNEHLTQSKVLDRELERLKWRSRRGLLELDILFSRFWQQDPLLINEIDKGTLKTILEFDDNDILDLLMARKISNDKDVQKFIERMQRL